MKHHVQITGDFWPQKLFSFEVKKKIDFSAILRVLIGESPGCKFENVMGSYECDEILRRYWNHPQLRKRKDNVPAHFLGTYHYMKTLETYFSESLKYSNIRKDFFNGTANTFIKLIVGLSEFLKNKGYTFRIAKHRGQQANDFLLRSWNGNGIFSLEPHEDYSQLTASIQKPFEIQKVINFSVVAANICLQNENGGELYYWNIKPDSKTRKSLGLEQTGHPYPLSLIGNLEKMVIPISKGDIYFFNGAFLHAVASHIGNRATLSFLMGFCDSQNVIRWT